MTDPLSPEPRSWDMAQIRSRNTAPELTVRKALHAAGFRFRVHGRGLPGKPDIVLAKWETGIFVDDDRGVVAKYFRSTVASNEL